MAIGSIQDSARSIADAYVAVLEFDAKIAEDKLQYSSWLLAVATAGFAIAVTQVDKVLDDELISNALGSHILVFASVVFGISATFGALVKTQVNRYVETHRQRMTLILRQNVVIEADPSVVPSPDDQDVDELVRGIITARYLPEHKREKWQETESAGDKAGSSFQKMLLTQQILVGIGYFAVFIASL